MELKNYQKNVISDLTRYLELLNETGNIGTAYRKYQKCRITQKAKNLAITKMRG